MVVVVYRIYLDSYGALTSQIMKATSVDQRNQYVLIPGGAGFIGSNCVIELVTAGYTP
ncbi:unnamed protein product, partial [Rotaria magnacalcarata]